jgi:hypothetical protein
MIMRIKPYAGKSITNPLGMDCDSSLSKIIGTIDITENEIRIIVDKIRV